jgi:hypothetical protein
VVQPYFPLLQLEPTRMLGGKMMAFVTGVVVGVDCCFLGAVGVEGASNQSSKNLGTGLVRATGRCFGKDLKDAGGINGTGVVS